ncbi:MAG: glycosyl hydrolase family 18 protein, partial [Dehalococcoidia bacterium]
MSRIPPRSPRSPGQRGPLDRRYDRDPAPFIIGGIIVFLAILLIVLFLPPISLLEDGGDEDEELITDASGLAFRTSDQLPALPSNLLALSPYLFEITVPPDLGEGPTLVSLKLTQPTQDPAGIAFYTYQDGQWQRLETATLSPVSDGVKAEAELEQVPSTLAVLRLVSSTFEVTAWLPPNGTLPPETQGVLDILNPLGLLPSADGTVAGDLSAIPSGGFQIFPTIRAMDGDAAAAVDTILADSVLTQEHVDAIAALAQEGGYDGIDIDYRAVDPSLRLQFADFIGALAQRLQDDGRRLSVTLPLPQQRGGVWDTGAYDWQLIGQAADLIKVMPQRDQSIYRAVMPEALTFATGQVPANKLFLVVSPFSHQRIGNDISPLPLVETLGIATTMSVRSPSGPITTGTRVIIAGDNIYRPDGATGIHWDDDAAVVAFSYRVDGEERTVWIENVFSAAFKLEMARRFGLGGVAVEDASVKSGGANIWPVIANAAAGSISLV